MDLLHLAGNISLVVATVPAVAAVVFFALLRWQDTAMGRHLMFYMIAIAGQLLLACIYNFLKVEDDWFKWLRLSWFILVLVGLWWRLILIVMAYRRDRLDGVSN